MIHDLQRVDVGTLKKLRGNVKIRLAKMWKETIKTTYPTLWSVLYIINSIWSVSYIIKFLERYKRSVWGDIHVMLMSVISREYPCNI